ncbi:hypothetical protein SDJN03_16479, partial [Cucurbita argyrosperma subsp. sororia]
MLPVSVLSACAKSNALDFGNSTRFWIEDFGLHSNLKLVNALIVIFRLLVSCLTICLKGMWSHGLTSLWTSLVDMYAKCGKMAVEFEPVADEQTTSLCRGKLREGKADLNPVEGAAVGLMCLELERNQVIGGKSYDWEIGSSSRDEDNDSSDDGSGSSRHQDRTQRQTTPDNPP